MKGRTQPDKIKMSCGSDVIAEQNQKTIELPRARYKMAEMQLSEKAKELSGYQAETIRVFRGESRLSIDLLNELVEKTKA